MPTINQLVRFGRKDKYRRPNAPALKGCPQKRGVVTRHFIIKPKKPNSAERKCCRVRLTTGREVTAFIPGENTWTRVTEHSVILLEGGGPPDLPGVNYRVVCGVLDTTGGPATPGQFGPRRQSRSLYGIKAPK